MKQFSYNKKLLLKDLFVVLFGVSIAIVMVKYRVVGILLGSTSNFGVLGSFFAGIFFTSVFTTAPAIAALAQIAHTRSVVETAFFGALGAVVGDLVIFRFVKDDLTEHMIELLSHEKWWKRVHHLVFHLRYFRWLTFFIGGLLIASPLPDEIGISLLGLSKMETKHFFIISFIFNFIGILIIGFIANVIKI